MEMDDDVIFATERLRIRKAIIEDASFYYKLWTNPDVMTNVGFPFGLKIILVEIEEKLPF